MHDTDVGESKIAACQLPQFVVKVFQTLHTVVLSKKAIFSNGKIEKTGQPLFAEKLFQLRKKQFVLYRLLREW